ncbi:hypothetical protein BN946_scf184756.g14 [Trametes cinnabarina]|uniref:PIN domain-like protein n=1 Tax=Pycnoporus cinnabarinus TaxID=5643 RepID=A0A060S830_PYCCI|nr:hypothetical protein BN946_scf184756.g14 [Trametes cinnabarina]
MEGKSMAIDSSIWIYQFQATMRDKEGRGLVNAHVLGFLRRICKLLFYGIKPVFVFDGGAPTLKMSTIAERKKKKTGAAASHAKIAEKLLAAQMRREALDQAVGKTTKDARSEEVKFRWARPDPPSSKKKRWQDHDPYKLPEVNMDEVVAKATASAAPDPRLATEEELRAFIEEMRPEDFDVTSPAFRELPTEVQYEIIGDLRLKSRQTSYKRLQSMLRKAKTPLDFSKEQIKNLKQRNALTQQLLVTTDSIGKAHITIPIRIASERNKQYVLIKNEGDVGGWVLGIRDEGTAAKPIEVDPTPAPVKEDSEDDEMEDVPIVPPTVPEPYHRDLREFRREQALAALSRRYTPKKLEPLTTKVTRKRNARPLFEPEEDELPQLGDRTDDADDPELSLAIQESLEAEEEASLQRALEESRMAVSSPGGKNGESSGSTAHGAARSPAPIDKHRSQQFHAVSDESDDEILYASPTRLETALSIGGAAPRRPLQSKLRGSAPFPVSSTFGMPTLLMPEQSTPEGSNAPEAIVVSESDEDMEEVPVEPALPPLVPPAAAPSEVVTVAAQLAEDIEEGRVESVRAQAAPTWEGVSSSSSSAVQEPPASATLSEPKAIDPESDEDLDVVVPAPPPRRSSVRITTDQALSSHSADVFIEPHAQRASVAVHDTQASTSRSPPSYSVRDSPSPEQSPPQALSVQPPRPSTSKDVESSESEFDAEDEATADPTVSAARRAEDAVQGQEDWDAAQELDPHAEEGEFARFLSQVKGKDIDAVRREIDEEIRDLNKQKKNAMRDSEDITQQMISQIMIMLRLFGIPYITAPMEAEAQCAALLTLGLVDGIITDDSDVFLFGGARVLKNMFNQSKTVECFLLSDLERELGLDRDKLVRLAYLLGSDYTEGLPGVGPVVAMELLNEFPGQDGLHKFKAWWQKVQSGRDKPEESASKFRRRFKKKFKDLYLPSDWPNPAVRDAYYHPTVDESREPFKWGMPDLDALRSFFGAELGWDQSKVDDLLLPIIRKMSKRSQNAAPTTQGNLSSFFDVPLGANAAPRKRQVYTSKRLQQVVQDFRKQQQQQRASGSASPAPRFDSACAHDAAVSGSEYEDGDAEKSAGRLAKKRKTAATTATRKRNRKTNGAEDVAGEKDGQTAAGRARGAGRATGHGRGRGGAKRMSRKRAQTPSESEEDIDQVSEELAGRSSTDASPMPIPEAVGGAQEDVDTNI